jgi:hypothetical protein
MTRFVPRPTAVLLTAALLAVAALGAVGSADAKSKSSTKITIKAQQGGFFGQVKSKRESCKNERKVILYKRKGRKPNRKKDKKIGSDIAQPNGDGVMWSINTDDQGKFYAYAKSTSKCKRGLSKSAKAEEPSEDDG